MDHKFITRYSTEVIGYLSSSSLFQDWPYCRQILLDFLAGDEPWMHALPILASQAVGGESKESIPVAAAWTVMHHAANLIDDVQDGDLKFREKIQQTETALTVAIAWIFIAFQMLDDPSIKQSARDRIVSIFSRSGFDSSMGQYQDLIGKRGRSENIDPLQDYWNSVILKSGSIYRAGTAGGAAVGTNSSAKIEALSDFGTALGVIRQVIDDCRDTNLDAKNKDKLSTLPTVIYTLMMDQQTDRVGFDIKSYGLSRIPLPDETGRLFTEASIPEIIVDILLEWRRRALESLQVLKPSQSKKSLVDIIEYVLSSPSISP